ncbi:hypothetical protein CTAYLR_007474 [Chrysophaeum taylorii]|uniref:Anoctamin transmembrane domain-containing protein n=1 Tax=Chrysophaeum taylorii TaxID=2483200 RepID=A0AAD7XMZ2_9STRA|nr:hypothetical protein CTAYLR_007474 [Chrysophaeum taylorii]
MEAPEYSFALVVPDHRKGPNLIQQLKAGSIMEGRQHKEAKEEGETLMPLSALITEALQGAGLETAVDHFEDHTIVLVRCPLKTARRLADGYQVLIDKHALAARARKAGTYFQGRKETGESLGQGGKMAVIEALLGYDEIDDKGAKNPYNFLHAPYTPEIESALARPPLTKLTLLMLTSRCVMKTILDDEHIKEHWERTTASSGRKLWTGLGSLTVDGNVSSAYALHEDEEREDLLKGIQTEHRIWSRRYERFVQKDIYAYFGVSVAFYFSFLSHYSRWLRYLAVGGVALHLGRHYDVDATTATLVTGSFGVLWCFAMLHSWNDRESRLALRWGMLSASSRDAQPRPNFVGLPGALDPVTGSKSEPYFPEASRASKQRLSQSIVAAGLLVALANIVFCKFLRLRLVSAGLPALPSTIVNAVFVFFLNNASLGIATRCAEAENHKYDADYEAAVFDYVFVFRVVNSYSALVYTAYLKSRFETCSFDDCFKDAGHSTMVFFLVQLTVGNCMEVAPAWLKFRKMKAKAVSKDVVSRANDQFSLAESPRIDILDDYLELCIQFGYCTLFFVCFPLAPLFALLNNLLEAKIDAVKRLSKRRPIPTNQTSIHTYTYACLVLSYCAIVNNAALVCFLKSAHYFPKIDDRFPLFVKSTLSLYALAIFFFRGSYKGLPYDVKLQLDRQQFLPIWRIYLGVRYFGASVEAGA